MSIKLTSLELRIFFSGVLLSGCSAAQSSAIQCFDAFLGIQHEDKSADFLRHMRLYMPPEHKRLVETLRAPPSLRDLAVSSPALCQAYNRCVSAMEELRMFHLCVVAKYIIVLRCQALAAAAAPAGQCPLGGVGSGLGLDSAGTGASNPMHFLKSVRDSTHEALISYSSLLD